MQTGRFGWVDYSGCLTICVEKDGLYISILPPFRLAHPAFKIPWSELHAVGVREGWFGYADLAVGDPPVTRIRLPLKVFEAARRLQATDRW
jgi:hypothetical protein